MEKAKMRAKSRTAVTSSLHSASPQVLFRNMAPDERVVRAVYERNAQIMGCSGPPRAAASVLVEPVPSQQLWDAEVRLGRSVSQPVRARAPSPDQAVQRAFDQLQTRALAS
jgi:hypothetical protein